MTYDALVITMAIIGVLSALFFILAVIADIALPWAESRPWRTPRPQATYRRARP